MRGCSPSSLGVSYETSPDRRGKRPLVALFVLAAIPCIALA